MSCILCYCRPGFENDAGLEIQTLAADFNCYGYFKGKPNTGWIEFYGQDTVSLATVINKLPFGKFIFIRQWFLSLAHFEELDPSDRINSLKEVTDALPLGTELRVEAPDSEEGKALSKLCRKFTVPLRQYLKKVQRYDEKSKASVSLFLFFTSSTSCFFGYAPSENCSSLANGILRLKHPNQAPSRSTLKLDEAFQLFIPEQEREQRLAPGLHAVDLGACPGGWTYQLVRRGMFVQAVDNGAMSEVVMETGQVKHYQEDGFSYEPKKKNVYWLVCDMIEKPDRVAKLMCDWLIKGWCKEAMFNLKLPMKKRYESVQECLDIIRESLHAANIKKFQLRVKQLYHDRDEVTVLLRKRPEHN
ncbi:MAG: 23S rRNA (cytidine(2498)-2'-O)-methyltransferase RlmM [Alteromonadaceae bacterium]|nr:23S rRNA (cytidine(2498)-2'-O)-methyltransferase RlmM [Alteromonadaceae bacterium]